MSIIKEVNVKLEQADVARKRAALLAQRIALKRASTKQEEAVAQKTEEEVAKKKEEEEAKRKKLEELKSRLSEVKSKVEENRKMREASAATGKGNVGEVKEEDKSLTGMGLSAEFPPYWKEITGASSRFKELGLLSG